MSHTRTIEWARLFELPPDPALPLHCRLRLAVVRAILDGRLPAGIRLPASRELARVLGVSRNTVTGCLARLIDDGFLESRPRSGVFVASNALPASAGAHLENARAARGPALASSGEGLRPDWSSRVLRSLSGRPTLSKPERWHDYPYPFVYGNHDPALFPADDFRECCVRTLARAQLPQWSSDFETGDVPDLVEQIRLRLLPKRGVFAAKDEVLVTVAAQQAFYLLAEALFGRGVRVGFEEPGYPHARNTFALHAPRIVPLPVDSDGLVVDRLPALDYLFVTPSHQSPTTVMLGLDRRERLLEAAQAGDFVVIEDDYEAENLYEGAPMPALKSLDRTGRVIYVGSVSKALSPALRIGYIVAPRALVAELRTLRYAMVRHPSALVQHVWALFLSLGHHESHARRVNQTMQERLAVTAAALREHLPQFAFVLPQGGASIWVRAPDWLDASGLAATARGHGVLIEPGDVFFAQPPCPCPFFRLRLPSIATARIAPGIRALAAAVTELKATTGVEKSRSPEHTGPK